MILSGNDVKQYIKHGGLRFDPPLNEDQFQQNGIDMILESARTDVVNFGEYVLGRTREVVTMPVDLMAFVHLRSTWARLGYIVPPTVIDAGFHGSITLEIAKFMPAQQTLFEAQNTPRALPLGQRFAHIIFAKLSTPSAPYAGKYQGQIDTTSAKKD